MLTDDKWVRIMPDHCSTGLWNYRGSNVDEEELPVSSDLIERLKAWQKIYDLRSHFEEDLVADKRCWEENIEIAMAVKMQLPDWTVVIFKDYSLPETLLKHDDFNNYEVPSV